MIFCFLHSMAMANLIPALASMGCLPSGWNLLRRTTEPRPKLQVEGQHRRKVAPTIHLLAAFDCWFKNSLLESFDFQAHLEDGR